MSDPKLYVRESNRRYRAASSREVVDAAHAVLAERFERGATLSSPDRAKEFFQMRLGLLEREVFVGLFLDNRHRILACEELFWGTLDGAPVYPREVAKRALELNAAAMMFAHNHPSGAPEPSTADCALTKRLVKALDLLSIRVLDHIVIGGASSPVSMAEGGLL